MAALGGSAISSILDNFADVIEGGYVYTGDSNRNRSGVAGTHSFHDLVDAQYTYAGATGATTTVILASGVLGPGAPTDYFTRSTGPAFFLVCTAASGQPTLLGCTRKISAYENDAGTPTFTVAKAFDPAISTAISNPSFTIREGFKRAPDGLDIEGDALRARDDFDRFFQLSALPGAVEHWYGNGTVTYRTTMELRLRFNKGARERNAIASVFENLMLLRTVLTRSANPDNRDGVYVRALLSEGTQAQISKNDSGNIVAVDKYTLIYRVDNVYS